MVTKSPKSSEFSIRQRWEIVFLKSHPLGPKLGYDKISKAIGIPKSSVRFWWKRYKQTGDVQDEEGRGRKRKTTERDDILMVDQVLQRENETSESLNKRFKTSKGTSVSSRTIRRRLKEHALHYALPLSKPVLSEVQRKNRLEWAKKHQNMDWSKVVFTDESTIMLGTTKKRTWQLKGIPKIRHVFKHPARVHIWGCISKNGFGKLKMFTKNLDSELMCSIYKIQLMSSVKKIFSLANQQWILLEDNDPKHTSKKSTKLKEELGIIRMKFPSNSPDLNPIENLWRILKMRVSDLKPKNTEQLRKCIQKIWKNLSKD